MRGGEGVNQLLSSASSVNCDNWNCLAKKKRVTRRRRKASEGFSLSLGVEGVDLALEGLLERGTLVLEGSGDEARLGRPHVGAEVERGHELEPVELGRVGDLGEVINDGLLELRVLAKVLGHARGREVLVLVLKIRQPRGC